MMEWIVSILLMSGALFMLVAAIGVVKLSDVYMRMHAITKAASLGAILMLAAVVLWHPQWIVGIEALMVVLFVILTAPIGAHMLARVAYRMQVPIGDGYVMDELKDAVEKGLLDTNDPNEGTESIDKEKI